jgi:hypothetical protein
MLSENFSIQELIKSQTAERRDINNNPGADEIHYMKMLAEKILQPVRDHYGIPFSVSSGYRCAELSIAIGSSKNSQHCKGQAADFEVPTISNWDVCHYIKDNLEFDQLILECFTGGNSGWIHCSIADEPRTDLLTFDRKNGYRKGLINETQI